jgi:hypothetical protein
MGDKFLAMDNGLEDHRWRQMASGDHTLAKDFAN